MKKLPRIQLSALAGLVLTLAATPLRGEGQFRNRDNKSPNDSAEGTYPVPYQLPTVAEITEALGRIRAYLDAAAPTRVIDSATGKEITDFSVPVVTAVLDRGEMEFSPLQYEMGVVHAGMLRAAEVTGDARFTDYTKKHLQFIADRLPYFQAAAKKFGTDTNGLRQVLEPRALDDCGSMCAALIRSRLPPAGPPLKPASDTRVDYTTHTKI